MLNAKCPKKLGAVLFFGFLFLEAFSQITAVTYNLRYDNPGDGVNTWSKRLPGLAKQVKSYDFDFLGTQEGLYHQLTQLSDSLGNKYRWIGVGRDSGNQKGEHCAIFYRSDRFEPVSEPKTFWLSPTPLVPSKGWDAALPRIVTAAMFRAKTNGQILWVMNTHFDHVGQLAREESVKMIWESVKPVIEQKIPVVVMGDFNLPDTSTAVKWMSAKLYDSRNANPSLTFPKGTFNGFENQHSVGKRIDYIFVSKELTSVLNYKIDDSQPTPTTYFSDHYPVITTLNINP